MLALYHFGPVANSLTPLLCLLEKGLPFESRFLDSRNWDHHAPEFQRLSPEGMVPILLHDDRVVRESTVINEYLEDVFDQKPLRPADPWSRAQMRVLTKFVDEYFCPALTVIGAQGASAFAAKIDKGEMARRLAAMPNAEVRRKWATITDKGFSADELADARRRLAVCLQRTEDQLAHGQDWLIDAGYGLADIKWYSMAAALPRVMPDQCTVETTPRTIAWLERMGQRAAVMKLEEFRGKR